EDRAVLFIVNQRRDARHLLFGGPVQSGHRDGVITQARRFGFTLFGARVVVFAAQVDDRLDAKFGQLLDAASRGLRAAIKALADAVKVRQLFISRLGL